MMRNGAFVPVFVLVTTLALIAGPALANDLAAARKAIDSYREAQSLDDAERRRARFAHAASAFARLSEGSTGLGAGSAEALANAGTAYLQAGQVGQAVLAFRRALVLDPRHDRSRKTLTELRAALPAWAPRPAPDDSFFRWHRESTLQERSIVMLAAFWMAAAIAALGIALGVTWLVWSSAVPAVIFIGALASALTTYLSADATHGIISAPETIARTADSRNASSRFIEPLPEGTEVRIEETREFWTHVRLADGSSAWVRRGSVTSL